MKDKQLPRPRSLASVSLEAWLDKRKAKQKPLALRLGLTIAAVSAYVRGVRVPKTNAAREIQRMTRGAVKLADWRVPAVDQ